MNKRRHTGTLARGLGDRRRMGDGGWEWDDGAADQQDRTSDDSRRALGFKAEAVVSAELGARSQGGDMIPKSDALCQCHASRD